MVQTKIVARFADGRILKGTTYDFSPTRDAFHVIGAESGARPVRVLAGDLKALFFVKDLDGNPEHTEVHEFSKPAPGRKVRVRFTDGEVLVGLTQAYQPGRPTFFVSPADPKSNNERVYVVAKAVASVEFIP